MSNIAYVAGVVDAVGHVVLRDVNDSKLPQLTVSSPSEALCAKLAELTGVKVTSVKRDYGRVGCAAHCDEPHMHVKSQTYRWQLVGARARIVLVSIQPLLVVKQGLVVDVLASSTGTEKSATIVKMRELGWV